MFIIVQSNCKNGQYTNNKSPGRGWSRDNIWHLNMTRYNMDKKKIVLLIKKLVTNKDMKCGWFWTKDWCLRQYSGAVWKGLGPHCEGANRSKCRRFWISLKHLMHIPLKQNWSTVTSHKWKKIYVFMKLGHCSKAWSINNRVNYTPPTLSWSTVSVWLDICINDDYTYTNKKTFIKSKNKRQKISIQILVSKSGTAWGWVTKAIALSTANPDVNLSNVTCLLLLMWSCYRSLIEKKTLILDMVSQIRHKTKNAYGSQVSITSYCTSIISHVHILSSFCKFCASISLYGAALVTLSNT